MENQPAKTSENISRSVTGDSSKQKNIGAALIDNRPQALIQAKMKNAVDSSPQIKQAIHMHSMANNHADVKQFKLFSKTTSSDKHVIQKFPKKKRRER